MQAALVHIKVRRCIGYSWWLYSSKQQHPYNSYLFEPGVCIWCGCQTVGRMVYATHISYASEVPRISRRGYWAFFSTIPKFIFCYHLQCEVCNCPTILSFSVSTSALYKNLFAQQRQCIWKFNFILDPFPLFACWIVNMHIWFWWVKYVNYGG